MQNPSPQIVIVDNDEGIVRAMAARLRSAGYQCLTAVTGSEGMALCTSRDVSLIVTDLQMPGLDGYGLISMIRSVSRVPIIVVTGYAERHDELIYQYDSVSVICKPFESSTLLDMVETELTIAGSQSAWPSSRLENTEKDASDVQTTFVAGR